MNPGNSANPRLLIVESDPLLGAQLHDQFGRRGFRVKWCRDRHEGLAIARAAAFEMLLLDLPASGSNGLEVLRQLREYATVPVILMAAAAGETERIDGFRLGADDYLPKPFNLAELHVRVDAILRRVAMERRSVWPALNPGVHDLRFDSQSNDVWYQECQAGLTLSEFRLLDTLRRQHEEVLSKAFLYQQVLQRDYAQHDRSLDVHVSQIRRKLKAIAYQAEELRTVWGKGYVWTAASSTTAQERIATLPL